MIDDRLHEYKAQVEGDFETWENRAVYRGAARHMKWFILYHVIGPPKYNYSRIGRQEHADRNSVKDAVEDVARRLEIALREPQRGRPRK